MSQHLDVPIKRASTPPQRTTRVRTVLSKKQLHMLQTCYNANPRPDALVKEQLVEMTGLSSRVIRVWFQNKRCKDKKRHLHPTPTQTAQKVRKEKIKHFKCVVKHCLKCIFNCNSFVYKLRPHHAAILTLLSRCYKTVVNALPIFISIMS